MRLRFADVTWDGDARCLLRGGEPVHVTPKAFALLGLLLEKRPAAVSRRDIQDTLWPGVFVTEGNIDSLVKEIRKALGDDSRADDSLLRTVHGVGYAFDGSVHEESPVLSGFCHALVTVDGDRARIVDGDEIVLGAVRVGDRSLASDPSAPTNSVS